MRDPGSPSQSDAIRRNMGWLLIIFLVAAALRFFRIGNQSLWTDEVRSIWMITHSDDGLRYAFHGPLHAMLLYLWSLWGGLGDVWARSLSAVIGLLTLPLLFLIAHRLGTARAALLAALLLAISPFHVWYSQEIRNYALLIALGALAQWLFLRLLNDARARDWVAYGLVSAGLWLTNLGGAFLIAAHGLYLIISARHLLWRFALVHLAVLLLLAPWLRHVAGGPSPAFESQEAPLRAVNFHPLAIPFSFSVFSVGFTVGPSLNEMNRSFSLALLKPYLWYFASAGLLFGFLCVRGLLQRCRRAADWIFYLTWIGTPILLVSLLAILNIKNFNVRYMAVALPGYLVLLGAGLDLKRKFWRMLLVTLVCAISAWPLWNHYQSPRYMKPDVRTAATYVEQHLRTGDEILVYALPEPFLHYYRGTNPLTSLKRGRTRDPAWIAEYVASWPSAERLWVVDYRGWYLDPEGRLEAEFRRQWRFVSEKQFIGMRVLLFEKPVAVG